MKQKNLISVYQAETAISNMEGAKQYQLLKKHEIRNLRSFCEIMKSAGCPISSFDGFYVGYSIKQIGKEFDLLRFGMQDVLNIEIKSELKQANKMQKLLMQMKRNYYYLKLLDKPIIIIEYVENDGFFKYNISRDTIERIDAAEVAKIILRQIIDFSQDPDKLFVPSNYLISPFNSTERFINGEYFLTTRQETIKGEIYNALNTYQFLFVTISANAGTGKTLLMYDMAKEQISSGKSVLIIHCGKLNPGHFRLIQSYNWKISSIRNISNDLTYNKSIIQDFDIIFVDESQRINSAQLQALTDAAVTLAKPLVFSYDVKQYLKTGETLDLTEYLSANYPYIHLESKRLTNKIRTNKELASFITNLIDIGKSKDHLDYSGVSIDYFDAVNDAVEYANYLKEHGWIFITFTTSLKERDPYDSLEIFTDINAHDVIGQEFSKVAFVMNSNFKYDENGKLLAASSYYSATGMLYQIVTRVVDELKILVLDNPDLYFQLLRIKNMGEIELMASD